MTRPELLIVALVYAAALVLAQRLVGLLLPTAQEAGFVVAALAGSAAAALLWQRRSGPRARAGRVVVLLVGGVMALLSVVLGLVGYKLWGAVARPAIALPIAAVGTLAAPFLIFPWVRKLRGDAPDVVAAAEGARTPVGESHVLIAAAVAAVLMIIAWVLPVAGRSNVRLVAKKYPGILIGMPDWAAQEEAATAEFGNVTLADPRSAAKDRFVALHWADADPVQAEEYVKKTIIGRALEIRDRSAQPIGDGRHEGTFFYLESPDRLSRAAVTVWNCPQDHRVYWVLSYLSGAKSAMLATHERIVRTVRCHSGEGRPGAALAQKGATAATQAAGVLPEFVAPPGFERDASETSALVYVDEQGRSIRFDAAVPGKIALAEAAGVTPEAIKQMLVGSEMLQSVDGTPQHIPVTDLQGHARHVWSAAGVAADGEGGKAAVQLELMIWYCDKRKMTFLGRYASPGRHDPRAGVEAMLPAVCHRE